MKINTIELLSLRLKNFLSYGNIITSIPLNFKEPTLIIGRNLDDTVEGQVDSNGSGKSTIINAVSYVCFDETIGNKIKKEKLVNHSNKKDMMVGIFFKKNENGNDVFYYVERFRKYKAKGGDGIRILKNSTNDFKLDDVKFITEHDITNDSINSANKQLEEILGMTFDVFSRIVVYSGSHESFFSLPVTSTSKVSQSEILEQLFDISIISEKSENLKKIISKQKELLSNLTETNKSIIAEKNRWNEQLNAVTYQYNNWNIENSTTIQNLIEKNDQYKSINFDDQYLLFSEINSKNSTISELMNQKKFLEKENNDILQNNTSYNTWIINREKSEGQYTSTVEQYKDINFKTEYDNFSQIKLLDADISNIARDKANLSKDLKLVEKDITSLTTELESLMEAKCPYCKQHYNENEKSIEEKSDNLDTLLKSKKNKVATLKSIENSLQDKTKELSEMKAKLKFNNENELRTSESKLNDALSKLESIKDQINPYSLLNSNDNSNKITNLDIEIKNLSTVIEKYKNLLKFSTEKELTSIQTEFNLLDNQIISAQNAKNPHEVMLNNLKNLEIPEEKTEEINKLELQILHDEFLYKLLTKKDSFIRKNLLKKNLTFLNTRLHFYLNKIGLPHKVQFNTDLTTSISKFNVDMDYENLSTGQKARINIALSFAFRDVLQKLHGKVSLCILDECLDYGLGNAGIQMAAKMIKSIAKTEGLSIFVISHRDEIAGMFESKLEIEYKSKFSRIVNSNIGVEEIEKAD